jgi:hypothetical protein
MIMVTLLPMLPSAATPLPPPCRHRERGCFNVGERRRMLKEHGVRIPKVIELTVDPGDDGEPTRPCERTLLSHTLVEENSQVQASLPASTDEPFR